MSYKVFAPVSKEGYLPIGILVVGTCIAFAISWGIGIISLMITIGCAFFFRDPARVTPQSNELILSPADGIIYNIDSNHTDGVRISVFLSVMNVHINRVPISGTVKKLTYKPGKFIRASSHKDSEDNESQEIVIATESNLDIKFSQIAGFIARRIVCDLKEGDKVTAGSRFGIIKFGSRVDIFIPKDVTLLVAEGQTVVGGETILADLSSQLTGYEYKVE